MMDWWPWYGYNIVKEHSCLVFGGITHIVDLVMDKSAINNASRL